MSISKAALAAALGVAAPAVAQPPVYSRPATTDSQVEAQTQANQPQLAQYRLSRSERAALAPLLDAAQASNWPAAQAALPAAQAAARGNDARYLVGRAQLQIGLGTNDARLQAAGVDAVIASGAAPAAQMLALYDNQARFAAAAGDLAKADRALDQVIALSPDDPLAIPRAARLFEDQHNAAHALDYYRRAIAAQEAAGHPVAADV
ncbi:MAG: hypothetical protein JO276_16145, partial [Sphingomonadaceae bacterium]|nr:hypothetical protein [Sphingomonadaceae bacterium]